MATTCNIVHPPPPVLTRNNYEVWCLKMRTLLRLQDCSEVVITGFIEPDPIDLATT